MPPDYHSSHEAFDIHIPDAQALDALDGLQTALHAFEAACHRGDPEIARMVTALNSRPYILEYIISGTLRVPMGSCELPTLSIYPSSARGGGIHKVFEVDSCEIPHIQNAKYNGCH